MASTSSPPAPTSASLVRARWRTLPRAARWGALGGAAALAIGVGWSAWALSGGSRGTKVAGVAPPSPATGPAADPAGGSVRLSGSQQRSIGLRTGAVVFGEAPRVASAPGRVAPDENQYAFITPRAGGVVRSVTAHVGQEVKAGDLLATIDSPVVGEARLDLFTKLLTLEIAEAQAAWEETVFANTVELLDHLRRGESPEQVHDSLQDRAVGANRERLMTAYAQFRLARATLDRNRDLFNQKLITPKDFEQVVATFEVAQSTYQSLMEELGYEAKLDNTRAQQARQQADSSVRAARERLRILGVNPDGTEPRVERGKVVGVAADGTISPAPEAGPHDPSRPETVLPPREGIVEQALKPPGSQPAVASPSEGSPVSTYSIWAPFDGTVLDREMIVPGVAVDTAHRIFTLANLADVWVEASVHESDFEMLDRVRRQGGKIRFTSPAYPDRSFEGTMIYSGDLVEEQSRTVKLLARADNPDRLLRPGMFVEVEVLSPRAGEVARIPTSALLTEGSRHYVYVKVGPDRFDRRDVDSETPRGDEVTVRSGLGPGDEVVTEGGYKLKAMAVQLANAEG